MEQLRKLCAFFCKWRKNWLKSQIKQKRILYRKNETYRCLSFVRANKFNLVCILNANDFRCLKSWTKRMTLLKFYNILCRMQCFESVALFSKEKPNQQKSLRLFNFFCNFTVNYKNLRHLKEVLGMSKFVETVLWLVFVLILLKLEQRVNVNLWLSTVCNLIKKVYIQKCKSVFFFFLILIFGSEW